MALSGRFVILFRPLRVVKVLTTAQRKTSHQNTVIPQKKIEHKFSNHLTTNAAKFSTKVLTEIEANEIRNSQNQCWNCGQKLSLMSKNFCENCESILPLAQDENYFSLLAIKKDFRVSLNELQFNFKKFQILLHPDKYTLKSETERNISETVSSFINKAYFTLLKPLSRGIYLLELHGEYMTEDVNSDDPEFLMEILSLNEQIAESDSIPEKRKVFNDVKLIVDDLTIKIAESFHGEDIQKAKQHLISYKYYDNILQKLKEMLPPV
uniref:Iron-sulfur cluster co-chaperone protein HscB, mitochondrial-like n=1 Tax=Phallusia mammillata TaxID=59560 RepID=A0A6F9DEP5_9ASCI|nr:iron-sulfur cluster co-chaperone protein HscB, mitochondrial-like [Phallusia mammillata]